MASLPGALDFAKMEEEICERWKTEQTFQMQNKLSLERGDEVCVAAWLAVLQLVEGLFGYVPVQWWLGLKYQTVLARLERKAVSRQSYVLERPRYLPSLAQFVFQSSHGMDRGDLFVWLPIMGTVSLSLNVCPLHWFSYKMGCDFADTLMDGFISHNFKLLLALAFHHHNTSEIHLLRRSSLCHGPAALRPHFGGHH